MGSNEIRKKFIDFYKAKKHVEIPNCPLVPENDPTTLFIGSGMQPLVPFLLGESHPQGSRLVNVQRCLRTEDLDEVGNARHHSFFEMLGCWSLGDYFKAEQIPWTFEFFVDELDLDPKKMYVTVFEGDENAVRDMESVEIWKETFKKYGIEAGDTKDIYAVDVGNNRIFYYPRKKNWWERPNAPAGDPAGPDTEIFYDTGRKHSLEFGEKCHINDDCGRFVEIGNDVFMEYKKEKDGYSLLEKKNVDVGWGFERIVTVVQKKSDNFETDLFLPLIQKLEDLSAVKFEDSDRSKWVYRIVTDHIRAACFLIADGVFPSNKAQGYVLRRLLRRIILFSRELNVSDNFLYELAKVVVDNYSKSYPHLKVHSKNIFEEIQKEEKKFQKTLGKGLREFEKIVETKGEILGEDAFMLYETYGFPFDLTVELADERGLPVDLDEFERARENAIEKSKSLDKGVFAGGLDKNSEKAVWYHTLTHLLHQALREVLGNHVQQAGSNITSDRLRFDFTHDKKMTNEEISQVEEIVNNTKDQNLDVKMEAMEVEDALKSGAIAFFKEKYADKVNVYSVGGYSKEICGGPHVKNTSEIKGHFKITKEESVGAGLRRIKAVVN